jgi:DNA-binding NtrC family response regulator
MSITRSKQANLLPMPQEPSNFDACMIDFKLPDGSRLDFAERIRSKWGATPIILISGYDPNLVALRAEKLGISEILQKPFSRNTIGETVKKAIDAPRAASKSLSIDTPASPTVSGGRSWNRFWKRPA